MTIELNCPRCAGRLVFAARRTTSRGRLLGSCDQCGSAFALSAGRVSALDLTISNDVPLPLRERAS